MSDLPNFKAGWTRQKRVLMAFFALLTIVLSTMAWAYSEETEAMQLLLLKFTTGKSPAMIGAPFAVKALIKNDADQTMNVDLQAVLYAKESSCVDKGKHINFSNTLKLKIGPNDSMSVDLNFDAINVPCEMSAGLKAFVNGELDGKRFPLTQDTDLSIEIL